MNKNFFVLNGSGGKGKDTFARYCDNYCRVRHESAIDPSKNALMDLVGYSWGDEKKEGEEGERLRALLSEVKALSIKHNDYPFKYVRDIIEDFKYSGAHDVLFIDVREPEEIEKLVTHCGARTILVRNRNVQDITTNSSDGRVEEFEYDFVIDNSGTLEDLNLWAFRFLEAIGCGLL